MTKTTVEMLDLYARVRAIEQAGQDETWEVDGGRRREYFDLQVELHAANSVALASSVAAGYTPPAAQLLEMVEVQAAVRTLGLDVAALEIRRAEDIAPAVEALKGHADALYVITDPLMATFRIQTNTLALGARLPTMHGTREFVETGGLLSYGSNFADQFRRAAHYVDKILKGEKPGELPIEQPTKFELVINLKTAKALGITVPPSLLARADEVIE